MKFLSLENKWFVWTTFLLLFFYLILRAVFITPYCDEVATLFEYIEAPYLIEPTIRETSANNHLLNTLLGKFVYLFFGDNMALLRIPNALSFILYFFSIKYIVLKCIVPKYQVVTFIALNSVAWIFEYFSYLRGYGLAIGLLFGSITLYYSWTQSKAKYKFILFLIVLWLSVFANLSFFNTSIILWGYSIVYTFMHRKNFKKWDLLVYALLNLGYLSALLPLIKYSFELKEAGALWWGNLSGIWECTGISLSTITLFHHNSIIKYSFIFLIILIGILGLKKLREIGFKEFITSFEGIFYTLFVGNIIMIELLANLLNVNYPHDRAAVQLVLFLIITVTLFFQKVKYLNYFSYLLLFFPISFIYKLSLDSSIYQTDHRLSRPIYHYLKTHLKDESSYSVCGLMSNSLNLELRKEKEIKLFNVEYYYSNAFESSFIAVESGFKPPSFYKLKFKDNLSKIYIYENTHKLEYKLLKDTVINFLNSNQDISLFQQKEIDSVYKIKRFKVKVSGKLRFSNFLTPLNLILTLGDSLEPNRHYHSSLLGKLSESNKNIEFVWNSQVYNTENDKKNVFIYFWNLEKQPVQYTNVRLKIYGVVEGDLNLK
jgi:hypothetical protein